MIYPRSRSCKMLSMPARAFRSKAAIVLAALYALCILAPSIAFAFSNMPTGWLTAITMTASLIGTTMRVQC